MGEFREKSDRGTLLAPGLFNFIEGKRINIPEPNFLPHRNVTPPYITLGDRLDYS